MKQVLLIALLLCCACPLLAQKGRLQRTSINDLFSVNSSNVWLVGSYSHNYSLHNTQDMILNSLDGGRTWTKKFSLDKFGLFLKIYFLNGKNGFVVGGLGEKGRIWKTSDGGDSWKLLKLETDDFLLDIKFLNQKVGWIVGQNGSVYRTADGGKTWQYSKINNARKLKTSAFRNPLEGWVFSEEGQVYATKDSGNTWFSQSQDFNLTACGNKPNISFKESSFFNEKTGIVAARCEVSDAEKSFNILADNGIIFSTKNGGKDWKGQVITEYQGLSHANFTKQGNIWVIPTFAWQSHGVFINSKDFGETWKSSPTPSVNGIPSKIFFADEQVGWLITYDGSFIDYLYKTDNGGESWKLLN